MDSFSVSRQIERAAMINVLLRSICPDLSAFDHLVYQLDLVYARQGKDPSVIPYMIANRLNHRWQNIQNSLDRVELYLTVEYMYD